MSKPRLRRELADVHDRIPNLAPMVDVIMVILVFFMLGATLNLSREGILPTELDPRSGPGPGSDVTIVPVVNVALAMDEHERVVIRVMGSVIGGTFRELRTLLIGRVASGADVLSPVVIGAQVDVPWDALVKTLDSVRSAGFLNVQFAVAFDDRGDS